MPWEITTPIGWKVRTAISSPGSMPAATDERVTLAFMGHRGMLPKLRTLTKTAYAISLSMLLRVAFDDAFAEMPFYTDDPGVSDVGMLHLELSDELDALQSIQYPDLRQNAATLKINVGLPDGVELDIDAPYIAIDRSTGTPNSRGVGDTNLGLKWKFHESSPGSREPEFAVSFYTELPTGNARQELGSGLTDYWLNFISELALSDRTRLDLNVGILFAGNTSTGVVGIETRRGQVYVGGLSLTHDVSSRFSLGAEIYGGAADRGGLDRTQLQAELGARYLVRDGIALSLGIVSGAFAASPRLGAMFGVALDLPWLTRGASGTAKLVDSASSPR